MLTDTAQSCDELCTGILFRCICIVCKIQCRTDGIVGIPLLLSLNAELRAVVNRRHSRQGIEQHMNRCKVCLILKLCIDTLHIMIVHEIIKLQSLRTIASHLIETFYRMGNLKIVVIIMAGIQRLVELIVGDGMQCSFIDPAAVIPVNHFTHKPELRLHFICGPAQRFHIFKIQHVRCIQTNTIYIKLADPEPDHITDIIPDCRIMLI